MNSWVNQHCRHHKDPPDIAAVPNVQLAAQAAMVSMITAKHGQHQWGNTYTKGINNNMRMQLDLRSCDPDYQRFSKTQKATLMGFCGTAKWRDVPKKGKPLRVRRPRRICAPN